jgi:hypothetical protein
VHRRELVGAGGATYRLIDVAERLRVSTPEAAPVVQRVIAFLINVGTMVAAALGMYAVLGMRGRTVRGVAEHAEASVR